MSRDIAVYVNETGVTSSLYENGKVVVYKKIQGKWKVLREKEFITNESLTIKDLRIKMKDVLEFLNECKVFVGLSVTGVPYFELEKADYSIWEFEGNPVSFLNYILDEEEKNQLQVDMENSTDDNTLITPTETSNGHYRISLKEIQENNVGVTSKQVLLPFLRKGEFYEMEVICNHIPPWLEAEFMNDKFYGNYERISEDEIRFIITKKSCPSL
ncbi:MAG: nitrogenase [Firmicutes bacterium]|nr:nitrogenase [Bacillota bacterium]